MGSYGRFGNQLYQYCFAKAYAKKLNAVLEVPENWIGRKIFNIKERGISRKMPRTVEDKVPCGELNVDLFGYYQKQECLDLYSKKEALQWLKIKDKWIDMFPRRKDRYIAAHLRRGDYLSKLSKFYCIVSKKSYLDACSDFDLSPSEVVWFSEESQKENKYLKNIEFLEDFISIINADVILRANSSFSWWAATLSNAVVYSPVVGDRVGERDVKFTMGNHPKMWSEKNNKLGKHVKHTDLFLK